MENRFMEMDRQLREAGDGNRASVAEMPWSTQSSMWSEPFSTADRVLVILIENGGVDLGIPELVDKLLSSIPLGDKLPAEQRRKLVEFLRGKIKGFTDSLIETAELTLNRYTAAKPSLFGDVVVLRDGTASATDLTNKLRSLAQSGKIIDLFILTHGDKNFISVAGGIDGNKIRAMKVGDKPLPIRCVYMMNCIGSTLNQAWIDAGARASSGSIGDNCLPEPTMFFFWQNWKAGQTFENAVTGAYRKTVNLINDAVRGFVSALPVPGSSLIASRIDLSSLDFVRDSAPMIQGRRNLTISSEDLSVTQSVSNSLATTVLPVSVLESLSTAGKSAPRAPRTISRDGLEFIARWEHPDQRLIDEAQKTIEQLVRVPLSQNQFDALVSFVSNIGSNGFSTSTLLRIVNDGNYDAVPSELEKWIKARQDGAVVDSSALVQRRAAESELFRSKTGADASGTVRAKSLSESFSYMVQHSYAYESPGALSTAQTDYSYMQNPLAAVAVADAIQIGLAGIGIVQAQASASSGTFSLTYDKAQRLLTNEARQKMPGSQSTKKTYSRRLLWIAIAAPIFGSAKADVIIEWEGNPYGEIGTPVIRKNLSSSTDWEKSSANISISKLDRIPLPNSDPRAWPIVYGYEGSYDPWGNGKFEFSGEFEINAFGGLKFNRHEVVSRSFADLAIGGSPEKKVAKGDDAIVAVPVIPQEQLNYLKARLP